MLAATLSIALAACSSQAGSTQQPTPTLAQQSSAAATTTAPATVPAVAATATSGEPAGVTGAAPACTAPAAMTPSVTEGPYFKAGSPEQADLVTGNMPGTRLVLTGYVLGVNCKPIAHALLDFWQADANGSYDNSGYTLRGHQYTDAAGRYQLTTVVPGLYPGRTEHIHVKVQAPNGPVLTTQLFFPGVANNSSDGIFDSKLLVTVGNPSANQMDASFNFVVSGG